MICQRRLLLGSLFVVWLGMVIACGGAGQGPPSNTEKTQPTENRENKTDSSPRQMAEADTNKKADSKADAKSQAKPEQRETEAKQHDHEEIDRQRREKLSKNKPAEDARRSKEDAEYRTAKAEFEASQRLKRVRLLIDLSNAEETRNRNRQEADRVLSLALDRASEVVRVYSQVVVMQQSL